jgi:S1-C subfamily serine protease
MRTRTFSILLIAALSGIGIASVQADQKASDPKADAPHHDDVQVTVTAGRDRLGFAAIPISRELRAHLGAPSDRGVLVDAVRADSPAARAGLRVGDVVTELDTDPDASWQSNSFRDFQGSPDHWFPFDREPQDVQGAIDELRRRMEDLEHHYQQHPPVKRGQDRI